MPSARAAASMKMLRNIIPLMPDTRAKGSTAYVCECGRKRVFQKVAIEKLRGEVGRCQCGQIIIAHDGVLYGTKLE